MRSLNTQSFVPIKTIKNGIIIRDDGVLCSIVLVSTLNFGLKSKTERAAILYQFQNLLNSLEVGTQILIQSRRLNIKPYTQYLEQLYKNQEIDLLKLQTREYIRFIKNFTNNNEIMSKQFFVIVTYHPAISNTRFNLFGKKTAAETDESFEKNRYQLQQRVSFVQNNIRSLGLKTIQLGTEEVTELIYKTFNPGETQPVPKIN